jgi:hypothetical protein
VAASVVVLVAAALPTLLGLDVRAGTAAPLLADWRPRLGPGTLPAVALATLACTPLPHRAARALPWRRLLAAAWALGVAWLLALAAVDGVDGLAAPLDRSTEYLPAARAVDDAGAALRGFVERIRLDRADRWPVHVAGHPPGALLFFVGLVRLGLGSGLAAGLVVVALAASTPLAVATTVRCLGDERAARIALPFLVIGPAALWQAVSADALFAAVGAWAAAALALGVAADRGGNRRAAGAWAGLAGALLGACLLLSYGLVLLALLAVAVVAVRRRWWLLAPAALAAVAVVAASALVGFAWWEAYPVLRQRYWAGIASARPAAYWLWADLACLAVSLGPALAGAAGAVLTGRRPGAGATVRSLVVAAALMVLVADLSLMSKAEVERIWLPFVPWLALAAAAAPRSWRRPALATQALLAVVLQHALWTPW